MLGWFIAEASPVLLTELILIILLFVLMTPYRLLLGIKPHRLKLFIEYFWYASVHYMFLITCCFIAVGVIPDTISESTEFLIGIGFAIIFSHIYYFLIVPMRLFPKLFGTSRKRIFGAFFAMGLFISYFYISIPLFYVFYIPAKVILYLRDI